MKNKYLYSLLIFISISNETLNAQKQPIDYVNTFIGTGMQGNTYPAAQAPFGMLSAGPGNTFKNYDEVDVRPGYKYAEKEIRGFALTHFSGVGCHAMQDIMFMPTGNEMDSSPVINRASYKSEFSHEDEKATPGYYAVKLKEQNIDIRFAAVQRSCISEINYYNNPNQNFVLEPTNNANGLSAGLINIDSIHNMVTGFITTGGFCWRDPADRPYTIYFVMEFDTKINSYGVWKGAQKFANISTANGKNIAAYISFEKNKQPVKMKSAISFVSVSNAQMNLDAEIPGWNIENVLHKIQNDWSTYLDKIQVQGGSEDEKAMFYTSIYHNLLQPNIFEDVNGEYIGFDDNIHLMEKGRHKYVNFSLWDTYRTTAFLQAIIARKESSDMIQSLLLDAQQGGAFPNWSMNNQEYGVMNGYSTFPFIANMYAMGAKDFDLIGVKDMMKKVSMNYYPCRGQHGWLKIDEYKKLGYVPVDKDGLGTSMTIEYGIDDYSIAKICEAAGDTAADYYFKRSQNVFNLFNPKSGFLQGRNSDGSFIEPFDKTTQRGFNEGNASQYFWSVPQNTPKLIQLAGGNNKVEIRIDTFISKIEKGWAPEKPYYWIGNEPCFGAVYIYNFLQAPWKAEYNVRRIINNYYKNSPNGLPGDDDAGAMSALYVFSALGLYPYIPATAGFMVTGPMFKSITIHLDNRDSISIISKNASTHNPYIHKMKVNGKVSSSLWLDWNVLSKGATLDFEMNSMPEKKWGAGEKDMPLVSL